MNVEECDEEVEEKSEVVREKERKKKIEKCLIIMEEIEMESKLIIHNDFKHNVGPKDEFDR